MKPPLPREEGTLTETLQRWSRRGYGANLIIRNGRVVDAATHRSYDPRALHVDATARFEGVSSPDDNTIAFALSDENHELRGVLVAPYGPTFIEEADVLTTLDASYHRG